MNEIHEWLLNSYPWVKYHTLIDLLEKTEDDPDVVKAREEMIQHPLMQQVISDALQFPQPALKSHKDAKHTLHKIVFLADMGLDSSLTEIEQIVEKILETTSPEGPFRILSVYPTHFGGSGKEELNWVLCDTPLLTYALLRFGYSDHPLVQQSIQHLTGLLRESGYPCATCESMGNFKGPGKRSDPCPYANLTMLRLFSADNPDRETKAARSAADTLLTLWRESRNRSPFLFRMGTNFRKLKAPLVWYDILHVAGILTEFPWLLNDKRLIELIHTIKMKADDEGKYQAESVWRAWKEWDFGQKREPSPWITFLVLRILKRRQDFKNQ